MSKRALAEYFPPRLRAAIARWVWDPARLFLWRRLALRDELRSGLTVEVRSHPDWIIYNEIFVNQEYGEAIEKALARAREQPTFSVVDLGANVGYFSLQAADLCWQDDPGKDLRLTAVEGSPPVFRELSRRINKQPRLQSSVRLINALVGEPTGGAYIGHSYTHYGHGISDTPRVRDHFVSYLDLSKEMAAYERIDLLKCDIEGAEVALIENFGGLLRKVTVAVFEFHNYGRDLEKSRRQLEFYGLHRSKVLRTTPLFTIELFERDR